MLGVPPHLLPLEDVEGVAVTPHAIRREHLDETGRDSLVEVYQRWILSLSASPESPAVPREMRPGAQKSEVRIVRVKAERCIEGREPRPYRGSSCSAVL